METNNRFLYSILFANTFIHHVKDTDCFLSPTIVTAYDRILMEEKYNPLVKFHAESGGFPCWFYIIGGSFFIVRDLAVRRTNIVPQGNLGM